MNTPAMSRYKEARQHMVESQLRPTEVTSDAVADAMLFVPREQFVPKARRSVAYVDEDLDVGHGRYLMEPMVFARLVQAADVKKSEAVLDIGCLGGYSSAVLAQLADSVVGLDVADFVGHAEKNLSALEIHNVAVIEGALAEGVTGQGGFDVIMLEGAVHYIPETLKAQLADGGRLVCVRQKNGIGRAHILTRRGDIYSERDLFDAHVPVLADFAKAEGFEF